LFVDMSSTVVCHETQRLRRAVRFALAVASSEELRLIAVAAAATVRPPRIQAEVCRAMENITIQLPGVGLVHTEPNRGCCIA